MTTITDFQNLIVTVENEASLMRTVINRPQAMNALNIDVIRELQLALNYATMNKIRVLIIEGAGEKAFVAGADIAQMRNMNSAEALQFARLGQQFTLDLEQAPLISIAKVQGYALGGGCELAMACDLLIAAESSVFGQPEVNLGLIPGFGGTQRLVKRIGLPLATAMLIAGRKLSGRDAFHCGLVSEVTTKEELETRVSAIAQAILKAGPHAVLETKALSKSAMEMPIAQGLAAEAEAFADCFARPEAREGITAFLEKRSARFSQ